MRVWGLGLRVQGLGFRVQSLGDRDDFGLLTGVSAIWCSVSRVWALVVKRGGGLTNRVRVRMVEG